jgi:ubiquinone biosynthesis protein Coq4
VSPIELQVLSNIAAGCLGRAEALLRANAIAAPNADVEAELSALPMSLPALDFDRLAGCPIGSLGRAIATQLEQRKLRPLQLRAEADTAGRLLALRRVLMHDALHVLLEFNFDLAGELGVHAFVEAQAYSSAFARAAGQAGLIYRALAPWRMDEFEIAEDRGRTLAAKAPRLLLLPLETEIATNLVELQVRLNIRRGRVLPSVPLERIGPPRAATVD